MGIAIEDVTGGVTKVILDGSLDIAGAAAIDLRMSVIGGVSKAVLVDMQQVSFIGSMGLRALVQPARAIFNRGGKMVIFGPQDLVKKVLTTSGIDTMIPIYQDYDSALAALA